MTVTASSLLQTYGPRDSMEYDLVIVGGGPAGLSAAIHAKQLAQKKGVTLSVCVLEKGSELGAHTLSGAVMDTRALEELFPDWKQRQAPLHTPVTEDEFVFLTHNHAFKLPHWLLPPNFKNMGHGAPHYIVSLANIVRWLGEQAEALGVDIFTGFTASHILYQPDGSVGGVITGDMGLDREGQPTEQFGLGMELRAKYTFFCEGARGHLGQQLERKYELRAHCASQSYGLGIKELWEVDPAQHRPGLVMHTAGWPLDRSTYGGAFLYHLENCQVAVGLIVGLNYQNPYLSPFEEFQRYKTHPAIRPIFNKGKRIAYGVRTIAAGGLTALPRVVFPGGALLGCDAGFLNAARIKGSHAAIKSGMLAAVAAVDALQAGRQNDALEAYPKAFKNSWLYDELYQGRNFKAWMGRGLLQGSLMVGLEQKLLGGNVPWTLQGPCADHTYLKPAKNYKPIDYPKPDGILTFDRLSSVFLSNTNHKENQPCHLVLKNTQLPVDVNWAQYAGPEQRYCPAGVYEFIPEALDEEKKTETDENTAQESSTTAQKSAAPSSQRMRLQINAQNCLHCKACDIKDPKQNITWTAPEGGGGPNYANM